MSKTPIHQGKLDCLCGLYAVINALNNMLPPNSVNNDIREEFFKIGITHLDKVLKLKDALLSGIEVKHVKSLIKHYTPYIEKEFGYTLNSKLVARSSADIRGVWDKVSLHLEQENAVGIVGLSEKHDHWSMIMRSSEKTWHMIDSDGIKEIYKKDLTTSSEPYGDKDTCISKGEVIGLWLEKIE